MSKKCILIVDDDKEFAETLADILADEGYDILTAYNSRTALNHTASHVLGLVIMDIKLGRENGFEVLKEIKSKQPKAEGLLITGYTDDESIIEASRSGQMQIIYKPIELDLFIKDIDNRLNS